MYTFLEMFVFSWHSLATTESDGEVLGNVQNSENLLSGTKKALFSSVGNRAKSLGVIGFEPTASCSQSRDLASVTPCQ